MEQYADTETRPYAGLSGDELVGWALGEGKTACLEQIGYDSVQARYFKAVARSAGVEWPDGFFESTVEELMTRR